MNPNKVQVNLTRQSGALKFNSNINIGVDESLTYGPTSVTGWFNGLSPDGPTGYVNYIKKSGSQGPTIYRPVSDGDFIAATKQVFGLSSNPVSIDAALTYWLNIDDVLATNFDYPTIKTTGLIYAIDPIYTGSWCGGNATIQDGINSVSCVVKGGPTRSKASVADPYPSMRTDGGTGYAVITQNLSTVRAISMWFYIRSSSYTNQQYLLQSSSGAYRISEQGINGFVGGDFSLNGSPFAPLNLATEVLGTQDKWVNVILQPSVPISDVITLMNTTVWNRGLQGYLGGVYMWNQTLSDQEANDHYTALANLYS